MKMKLLTGAAFAALIIPGAAMAQSTGTLDAENRDVVVTGARGNQAVGGIQTPETPKARGVLTQEFISRETPGQSVDQLINALPGVSFQNNDPFGNAGGTLTIRGFDASRISQTVDGIPLNDTGNYAIYSNQQVDSELIDQVNVNLGTTDVDSPSASATGSTVNYRTIIPTETMGARLEGSIGDDNYFRVFGLFETGDLTKFGTRAWISGSDATNRWFVNDFGKIDKQQYNAKIYQPIGGNGDFISVAGNYNQNRNNFGGSAPLRTDSNIYYQGGTATAPTFLTGVARTPGTGSFNNFPTSLDQIPYHVARCNVATANAGVTDAPNSCGTSYDERYNPSNTLNVRFNSRFTLAHNLVLTVDPYYQYTKANGGGTTSTLNVSSTGTQSVSANAREGGYVLNGVTYYGYINGGYYFGRDLNGDGDTRDTVTLLAPSETKTHRYGVTSSLRWDVTDDQSLRVGYTHDYGRHRQTGELDTLQANGVPTDVFPENNPLVAANGYVVQKRDRLSFAILDEGYGEYTGKFFDRRLTVQAGVTGKFFTRDLNNFCFTTAANGNVNCLGRGNDTANASYAAANPYAYNATTNTVTGFAAPQGRSIHYNRVLPSAGLTYKFDNRFSIFASYSKGLQVPGTDNLYNAFYYPDGTAASRPAPETSDNFDAGIRYTSSKIQASVGPWYTRFSNRLASAFDPDTQVTIYRNLGRVDKYGVDGSVSYSPIRGALIYAFGSYLKSEIKNNVLLGNCTTTTTSNCTTVGQPIYALTAGKRESGAPVYTAGGRLQYTVGPLQLGGDFKRTGQRYLNDQNLPALACTTTVVNQVCPTAANITSTTATRGFSYQTYGASAPAYNQVDFDARLSLEWLGLNKTTYFQVNLENAFSNYFVGGFSGGATTQYSTPFAQIGYPRTIIGTLNVQF